MSGGFQKWLEANGETLPPCSCSVLREHDAAWRHESTCEYKIYREHFELIYHDRIAGKAAALRNVDPLAPSRGFLWALIAGLVFWAIVAAIVCSRSGA